QLAELLHDAGQLVEVARGAGQEGAGGAGQPGIPASGGQPGAASRRLTPAAANLARQAGEPATRVDQELRVDLDAHDLGSDRGTNHRRSLAPAACSHSRASSPSSQLGWRTVPVLTGYSSSV